MSAKEQIPSEPPPDYATATGGASSSSRPQGPSSGSHLNVPNNGGLSAAQRKSMEDERRPLPQGWIRQFDDREHHQFFVDTTKDPPRSIWHHPYDDDEYLASLSHSERQRLEQERIHRHENPSRDDLIEAHSEDEDGHHHAATGTASSSGIPSELPPRPDKNGKGKQDNRGFGRKMKDKLTGMTHEERVQERKKREEAEQKYYEQQMRIRQAMVKAQQTGQPQLIGKDKQGKDVYVEPPQMSSPYGGYGSGGYGYSPYSPNGYYSTPSATYMRPSAPYGRPYGRPYGGGYGYGGGFGGAPLALGLGGGLMGGLLLGDMMGGGGFF